MFLTGGTVLANSSETEILGSVSATIINVSAPTSVFFSINPNVKKDEISFTSSAIQIVNKTNAPIALKIAKGSSNFTLNKDSSWKPVNTMPSAYEWRTLGVTESESYISLGIKVDSGDWKTISRTEALYVREHNNSDKDISFGEIANNSTANMSLVGNHGFAFKSKMECTFRVVWSFSLGN